MIPIIDLIDNLQLIIRLLSNNMISIQIIIDGKNVIGNGSISGLHLFAVSIYQSPGRFYHSLRPVDNTFGLF